MSIGPKETQIGVRVRGFWAGLKIGQHKPEWGVTWERKL